MKSIFKRFLCAAALILSCAFVGTVADAIPKRSNPNMLRTMEEMEIRVPQGAPRRPNPNMFRTMEEMGFRVPLYAPMRTNPNMFRTTSQIF